MRREVHEEGVGQFVWVYLKWNQYIWEYKKKTIYDTIMKDRLVYEFITSRKNFVFATQWKELSLHR
jgi:hypothetical protein